MKGKLVNTDLVAGLFGLAICGIFYLGLPDETTSLSLMFPEDVLIILVLISVGLLIKSLVKPERAEIFSEGVNARWLITGGLIFAWVLVMPWLGFIVSTLLGMTAIVTYLATARVQVTPRKVLLWAVIVAVVLIFFYLVFTRLLRVPLPEGWFI